MIGKTHVAVALCVAAPIVTISNAAFLPLTLIAAKLPDIDQKLGIKHRGITHSILCMGIATMIVMKFSTLAAIFFFIGYCSHLILDSLTRAKIPLLYPYKKRFGLGIIKTGGPTDYFMAMAAIYIIINRLT